MLILFKKFLNSYLTPRFLFKFIITNQDYELLLNAKNNKSEFTYKLKQKLSKLFYFWPTITDVDSWVEGDFGKYRDPSHFKELRPGIDVLLLEKVLEKVSDTNSPVLDLGCNSGRHIEYLYNRGLRNLVGVDIMKNALLFFKKRCPECYGDSKLYHDFFQRFLLNSRDNEFDLLYSVGATIELVHPSFDIISEMCRVSNNFVILLVQENSHSYPRFYITEFLNNNFSLDHSIRPINEGDSSISLLVFKKNKKKSNVLATK